MTLWLLLLFAGLAVWQEHAGRQGRADGLIAALALAALGTAARAGQLQWQLQRRRGQRSRESAPQPWTGFVAASHDAVISETVGGVLTGWNRAARQLFGYSAPQMLGQSLHRLVPAARRQQHAAWVARAHRGEALSDLDTEWLRSDGRTIPVAITLLPSAGSSGGVSGLSYVVRDLSGQRALEEALRQRAFHDPLTRLPNRRLLRDRLGRAQQSSRRTGSWAAVLALGLEPFKRLQQRLGQQASEQHLLAFAKRLSAALRETDTVARLDGAEFIVVCENLGQDRALASLRVDALEARINAALTQPALLRDETMNDPINIGHRLFSGSDDDDIDDLIADASQAMQRHRARRAPAAGQAEPAADAGDDDE